MAVFASLAGITIQNALEKAKTLRLAQGSGFDALRLPRAEHRPLWD